VRPDVCPVPTDRRVQSCIKWHNLLLCGHEMTAGGLQLSSFYLACNCATPQLSQSVTLLHSAKTNKHIITRFFTVIQTRRHSIIPVFFTARKVTNFFRRKSTKLQNSALWAKNGPKIPTDSFIDLLKTKAWPHSFLSFPRLHSSDPQNLTLKRHIQLQ